MPICALCHQREADKTGSHLVPLFLMRTVDHIGNKKERGMDLGFELGKGHVKGYFGGGVLPEHLEPVFGEVSEADIAVSRSSMIVDHLLCSYCESFYSATLNKRADQPYQSTKDSFHAMLFWISVFWRFSVSENKVYHLSEIDEHHLRIILDGGLDTPDIPDYIKRLGAEVTDIRYRVLRCPGYTIENPGWLFLNVDNSAPYCFLIGEFAVFLYLGNVDTKTATQPFLGLEEETLKAPLNNCSEGEFIWPVTLELFTEACRQAVAFWKADFLENVDEMCDKLHQRFIGKGTMEPQIKQQIIDEISADDKLIGRQYSIEGVVEAMTKTLMKFEPYRSIAEQL
jgi:hypothetical protein